MDSKNNSKDLIDRKEVINTDYSTIGTKLKED